MYTSRTKCGIVVLCLVLTTCTTHGVSPDPASIPGITISLYAKLYGETPVMSPQTIDKIRDVFGEEANMACGPEICMLSERKVIVTVASQGDKSTDGGLMFGIEINVILRSTAQGMIIKQTRRLSKANVQQLLRAHIRPDIELLAFMATYRMDTDRPAVCGDGILHQDEMCDDYNLLGNDGCSPACVLEDGYMCYGAWRDPAHALVRGKMTLWETDWENVAHLIILDTDETCLASDIDLRDDRMFDPGTLYMAYENKTFPTATKPLPAPGYYSRRFCNQTFPVPALFKFDGGCALVEL